MNKEGSYVLGIIGAFVGGMVATVPWILMYVYGQMILSLLAIIIGLCSFYGYKLCKGKMSKKVPIIITVISLLSVSIATFVIIPLLLLEKEGFTVTMDNLEILYDSSEFTGALIKDYVISLIFTFLGISGVIAKIRGEVEDLEA